MGPDVRTVRTDARVDWPWTLHFPHHLDPLATAVVGTHYGNTGEPPVPAPHTRATIYISSPFALFLTPQPLRFHSHNCSTCSARRRP